jgi:hypothetical protein
VSKLLHNRRLVIQLVGEPLDAGAFAPLEDVLRTLYRGSPGPLAEILRKCAREGNHVNRAFITRLPGTTDHDHVINDFSNRVVHCECQLALRADMKPEVCLLEAQPSSASRTRVFAGYWCIQAMLLHLPSLSRAPPDSAQRLAWEGLPLDPAGGRGL